MKKTYKKAVVKALERTRIIKNETLTEEDIQHLPAIVQKYLHYSGSVGKEKVLSFRAEFTGGIRSKSSEQFMPLKSVQYNFIDNPSRFFYIVAKKKGIPAKGIHLYKDQTAIMLVKIFGLFTVVNAKGKEMNQGETVTVFNDMCFMAPAALIDCNIEWEEIDVLTVDAKFTNGKITIGATLYFNEEGELVNFLSNDRFETRDGKSYKNYPWLTPVTDYTNMNGYRLPSGAKLIYKHPDEDLCYGEFALKSIEYNCKDFK
ncbi:MAG: hypothetical protein P1P83_00965 [Bacteroidales bacterium]|nr:hypothetical protein [Bacteroidales bacterium]MDT8372594.1 hypothetical protein [Bacteroidales bacterium]